jgi:hypothetical protein
MFELDLFANFNLCVFPVPHSGHHTGQPNAHTLMDKSQKSISNSLKGGEFFVGLYQGVAFQFVQEYLYQGILLAKFFIFVVASCNSLSCLLACGFAFGHFFHPPLPLPQDRSLFVAYSNAVFVSNGLEPVIESTNICISGFILFIRLSNSALLASLI